MTRGLEATRLYINICMCSVCWGELKAAHNCREQKLDTFCLYQLLSLYRDHLPSSAPFLVRAITALFIRLIRQLCNSNSHFISQHSMKQSACSFGWMHCARDFHTSYLKITSPNHITRDSGLIFARSRNCDLPDLPPGSRNMGDHSNIYKCSDQTHEIQY